MKQYIKRLLRESFKTYESKNEFYRENNIDPDNLSYLGSGDFGEAYSVGDGRVLKKTTSKKEYEIASELVGKDYDNLANIYAVGEIKLFNYPTQYLIVLEEVEEDSNIENSYYQLEELTNEQGISMEYLHYLETDELDLDDEMIDFISQIEDIYRICHNLGIVSPDIRPENLGIGKNGKIKLFDIDDKRR